jgi:uncharacterized protein involved in exopolysaccharide biosynthesis
MVDVAQNGTNQKTAGILARMTDAPGTEPVGGPDLFTAVGRHLALFLLPIVACAGIGAAYGLVRKQQYTAESRISIGQLSLAIQGIPGFVGAASNLSAAYARTIGSPDITRAAAKAAGVSPQRAADALRASSIANTPLFRVQAEDTNRRTAIKLANSGARALILHVLRLNQKANLRGQILVKYKRAAKKVVQLQRAAQQAGNKPSSVAIRARLSNAFLRQAALANLYKGAAAGEVTQNLLQVVRPAAEANGDRDTTVARGALIGGLIGLLLGLALAAGREASLQRRAV